MHPPPMIYISSIPMANQNNVYPQIRFIYPTKKKHILFIIYASFVKILYDYIIFLYFLRHLPHLQYHQKSDLHCLFPK